eukprot:m.120192 g.120192  ORF g.120192 m.120192 type:complete len:91 (+) comp14349_c0_seq3:1172-1444(+)
MLFSILQLPNLLRFPMDTEDIDLCVAGPSLPELKEGLQEAIKACCAEETVRRSLAVLNAVSKAHKKWQSSMTDDRAWSAEGDSDVLTTKH